MIMIIKIIFNYRILTAVECYKTCIYEEYWIYILVRLSYSLSIVFVHYYSLLIVFAHYYSLLIVFIHYHSLLIV